MQKLDGAGRIGDVILKSSTPPLLNSMDSHGLDDIIRKSDNHSAPPILLDHHQRSPGQILRPMVDLSSTQMLLHMMRSANSAIAAESTGAISFGSGHKRSSVDAEDVLDLSVKAPNSTKRWRGSVDGCGGLTMAADPIGLLSRTTGQRGRLNINNNNNNNNHNTRASSESFTDLSRSSVDAVDVIKKTNARATFNQRKQHACVVNCPCRDRKSPVIQWNVDDVCAFVSGVDACADYVQAFRDQSIDGGALCMLTEDHLTNRIKMKLGHALRFKAALAKLIGACSVCLHCVHCHQQPQQSNGSGVLQRQA
ncbi:hypothetical protein CHUAL_012845 [Chamberlinius hualienensis]